MELFGHILGFLSMGVFVLSYQIFDRKKLMLAQSVATGLMSLQYLLLGAWSGFGLNLVCLLRNFFFYHRDKKFFSLRLWPVVFALLMAAVSFLSWDGWHSLFIILGLMLNTLCMGFLDSQGLRKSILLSCPLIITYNVFEGSVAGVISESISIVSAVIGIIRYYKVKKLQEETP